MSHPAPRPLATKLTAAHRTKLRARLQKELEEALSSQAQLRSDIAIALESRRGVGTDEAEDPEGSSLAFEQAQANAMLGQSQRHASEISAALARIDAGTYGSCSTCSRPIAVGRLDARPSTAFCIACAS
ncbi:MAG: TraR/DksA family transcriptional regulator [Rhodoglobus sp.]|nr:TraR/DksA family transcriptional regulator [Rhodoglobus sp.]